MQLRYNFGTDSLKKKRCCEQAAPRWARQFIDAGR
jgi:hypothetical protein